jgi:hypothetical protein
LPKRTDARRSLAAATLISAAALALGAAPASAVTSAEQVYEKTTYATPSALPAIPAAPVRQTQTAGTTPVSEVRPLPLGTEVANLEDPVEDVASPGGTLPVTGWDVTIFLVAAVLSAVLGLALCVAGARRA